MQLFDGSTQLYNWAYDSFGQVAQGSSAVKQFNVTNTGDQTLEVDYPSTPYGFNVQGSFPLFIAPGNSASFSLSLDTSNPSSYYGQLSISDSDPNDDPFLVNLDGAVVAPPPALSVLDGSTTIPNDPNGSNPDDFGSTPEGSPLDKAFTITNSSSYDIGLSNLSLASGFSLVGSFPSDVPANSSRTFTVELDANSVSSPYGELSFNDTDPGGGSYQFAISGRVTTPPPCISVLDGNTTVPNNFGGYPINFGSTFVGTPIDVTFTVANSSASAVSLTSGSLSLPAGFSLVGSFPSSVPANGSTSFTVALAASAAGMSQGNLSFLDSDPGGGSYQFGIQGTVVAAPVANDDSYSVSHTGTLNVLWSAGVMANDDTAGDNSLVVQLDSGPQHGTLNLNGDGSFRYTPVPTFVGADTFSYQLSDGNYTSNTATVSIQVTNAPPVVVNQGYQADVNTPFNSPASGVLAGASDADGDPLAAQLISGPANGALTLAADGSFTYTPNNGFLGVDSFTYCASDGFTTGNTATASITVSDPNSIARNDSYRVTHDHTLSVSAAGVLANDGVPGGLPLTAQLSSGPSDGNLTLNADGSFVYTSKAGFVGLDQFVYAASDGITSGQAAVAIMVTNTAPVADDAAFSESHDRTLTVVAPGVIGNANDDDRRYRGRRARHATRNLLLRRRRRRRGARRHFIRHGLRGRQCRPDYLRPSEQRKRFGRPQRHGLVGRRLLWHGQLL
jgi:hypothetical protein